MAKGRRFGGEMADGGGERYRGPVLLVFTATPRGAARSLATDPTHV
jgi:hypothetical protein